MPAEVYEEKARSYASVWVLAALIGIGFVIDLLLGGGVAHLPGWALAFVIVVGLNALVVRAARSEKSLRLTADALSVGEETIDRSEIAAIATGADDAELPVLGWPSGPPRGMKALTLRLAGGQHVRVPTRFPDQLAHALGVSTAPAVDETEVRAAARSELGLLAEIDRRAEVIFRTAGYDLPEVPFDADGLAKARAVFVAGRPPVAFVRVDDVDGLAHVDELAVIPRRMRQGIGGRLLERACEWARDHDYPAITLITYADVPWNRPFYAAHGFVETDDLTPGLTALRDEERELGLDAVGRRIVMRRELG